jgi:hypothetical protein
VPLQTVSQGAEVLNDLAASLGMGEHALRKRGDGSSGFTSILRLKGV